MVIWLCHRKHSLAYCDTTFAFCRVEQFSGLQQSNTLLGAFLLYANKENLFFFFFSPRSFCLFRAAPVACGGSQTRGLIGAVAVSLHQSHSDARSEPHLTSTTAHGNTGSLTHWARQGMEPATSWFLVGFISTSPWRELWFTMFYKFLLYSQVTQSHIYVYTLLFSYKRISFKNRDCHR